MLTAITSAATPATAGHGATAPTAFRQRHAGVPRRRCHTVAATAAARLKGTRSCSVPMPVLVSTCTSSDKMQHAR